MTSNIQKNIKHVVVLMLENRSADNLIGWLYEDSQPKHFSPTKSQHYYNGLAGTEYSNPVDLNDPKNRIKASKGVDNFRVPNPDPNEAFNNINQQLFGLDVDMSTPGWLPPENAVPGMQGFLYDYSTAKCSNKKIARQIMSTYSSEDLTALCQLAKGYAVSDNYHASCPTQTWPNRAFMHAGTSCGKVNNFPYMPYDAPTIFNAFEDAKQSWCVYKSSEILPSLTRIQMVRLWDPLLDSHFHHISKFVEDCRTGDLPSYSFLEPSLIGDKYDQTSEHPPADVCAGDHFLQEVWTAISTSPAFADTLFIINFDEHGGCPDHVPPNWTATSPGLDSSPGDQGFCFNRFGVRVPAIFISPHINENTVFRASEDPWSKDSVPYDHTSILAMLLDWKGIDRSALQSDRVQSAPLHPFDELIHDRCREDMPAVSASCKISEQSLWQKVLNFVRGLLGLCADGTSLTSLQKSIVVADAHFRAHQSKDKRAFASVEDVEKLMKSVKTQAGMRSHFERLRI